MSYSSTSSFDGYIVTAEQPETGFYAFVLAYVGLAFLLLPLLVIWGNQNEAAHRFQQKQQDTQSRSPPESPVANKKDKTIDDTVTTSTRENGGGKPDDSEQPEEEEEDDPKNGDSNRPGIKPSLSLKSQRSGLRLLRELDRVATDAFHPDRDPDFISRISSPEESNSIATTSRLYKRTPWDVGARRWKHRRPLGRVDVIQRAMTSQQNTTHKPSVPAKEIPDGNRLSALANRTLCQPEIQCRKCESVSSISEPTIYPNVVDDLRPSEAADADDPGKTVIAPTVLPLTVCCGPRALWRFDTLKEAWDGLLDIADPDQELVRILALSFPLTMGAMSEPLLRTVVAAFIANFIGSDAMVAFLLVILFVRLTTEEISAAIVDVESNLVQEALYCGNATLAGEYVQLAVLLQIVAGVPVLVVWALVMEPLVDWLVSSEVIAELAGRYTRVVALHYLVQALSRTSMVIFHLAGHEHFGTTIDLLEGIATLVLVAFSVTSRDKVDLESVAWIQVTLGLASAIIKFAFVVFRGWIKPFRNGIFGFKAILNKEAWQNIIFGALPLLVGTFLEFGEWELLTLFVRHLGAAEVATWALLGTLWEVFEAATEGIGEAAATRVAYHLGMGQPKSAQKVSHKVIFLSTVQSLIVVSILYMTGKHLCVTLTTSVTMQWMLYNVLGLAGLGIITMNFAQVCWSLVGAQGRYRLATLLLFISRWAVAMPIAMICIFGLSLDLNAVMGAVVLGYSTSCCSLAYCVLRSDWERLSRLMQELNAPPEDSDFSFDDDSDGPSSDDS